MRGARLDRSVFRQTQTRVSRRALDLVGHTRQRAVERGAVGGAGCRERSPPGQRVQLLAEAIEGASVAPDLVGGVDQLGGVQPQAEIARSRVPRLIAALDHQWPVEQLLDTRRDARQRVGPRKAADRGAQSGDAGVDLVPVGELEQGDRRQHEQR